MLELDADAPRGTPRSEIRLHEPPSTVERLARRVVGEIDRGRLADHFIEEARELCRASVGAFVSWTGEGTELVAGAESAIDFARFGAIGADVVSRILRGQSVVRIDDAGAASEIQSCVARAVVSPQTGELFGALVLGHVRAGFFTDDDERALASIATYSALAMENARLLDRAQRSERENARQARQALLAADVASALVRERGLRPVLQLCAEAVVRHVDAAFARIWTTDANGEVLELQASAGMYVHLDGAHAKVPVGALKIGRIASERKPHLTNDVLGDERVGDRAWAAREGLVSFAGYPLVLHGRVIGVLALFSRARLADDTIDLLAAVADTIALGIARARSEQALRDLNEDLERRVHERTAALLEANKELEAFSYTVSHDLRAPIRHVAGFVDLLREHAGSSLDAKGARYVDTIGDAAKHMGALIDGLLAFSRTGRTALHKQLVDTEALVREVFAELQPELGERRVSFTLGSLPRLWADPIMLRVVFTNLLSNAFKYSSLAPESVVEVSSETTNEGHVVVLVRDNGVGFSMAHSEKLFGVFQRLHPNEKFEGTGIGLATVKRIITRHGGQVWAAGAEGLGATFFFTLPTFDEECS